MLASLAMRVAFNSPARNHFFLGESFNGRTAGLQPANEGSIPSSSTKFAREAVAVKAPVRNAGQARSTRAPGTNCDRGRVAQAADCGSVHEGSIPSGHPIHWEVVQRPGRGPLKPATA